MMLHLINGSRAAKSAVLLSVSCAVLLAVSCVSVDAAQSQPGHKDTTMPSGAVSGDLSIPAGPISIPQNAGTKYSKRTMVLYLDIETTKSGSLDLTPGGLQAMKVFIESELPRLKRFKVYSVFNNVAQRLVNELEDVGDVEYQDDEAMPAADATLNISMDIQVEKGEANLKDDDEIYYTSVMSVNLAAPDGEIIASRNFKTMQDRKYRMKFNPATRKRSFAGGFNPNDADNVNKVLQQLGRKQLVNLALWLGKQYPITCNITGMSRTGTKMGGDQGFENGLRNDVDVVIWGDDMGIPTAIAAASVEAQSDKSAFTISRWNTDDPDAALWIKDIQEDRSLAKELMATTYSMPFPKEWMEAN